MDTLTVCKRCSGNACYEQYIDETTKTWLCMACGFTTSTVMQDSGAIVKTAVESSPELYKDLKFVRYQPSMVACYYYYSRERNGIFGRYDC